MVGMPTLDQIRYLDTLVEEAHFGRAAERLGITQPSLSQAIARLEHAVGFRVVERSPFGLTPAGAAFLESGRQAPARVEAAVRHARDVAAGLAGELRMGFAGSVLLTPVAQLIRTFREEHPRVALRLTEASTATQLAQLSEGVLDLAVVRQPAMPDDIDGLVIVREAFMLAVPAGHPLAAEAKVPLAALRDEAFVLFPRSATPGLHGQIMELCARHGFAPRVVQEATEWLAILGLVEAGTGIALVPECFRNLRWGSVSYVGLDYGARRTTVVLCWHLAGGSRAGERFVAATRAYLRKRTGRRAPASGSGECGKKSPQSPKTSAALMVAQGPASDPG